MRPRRGVVCLQGGAEFGPGCEPMDTATLYRADGVPRRVLIAPLAGRPGREREVAAANARRWYVGLGARDVTVTLQESAFAAALADAELLVLPGGSPSRLLEALGPHEAAMRSSSERGMAINGSSAGAMVLCRTTALPGSAVRVVPALGLVPIDLVIPHYRGDDGWLEAARPLLPRNAVALGLPERSGALVDADGAWEPTGVAAPTLLTLESGVEKD